MARYLSGFRPLLVGLLLCALGAAPALSRSTQPDFDGSNLNDTFETAMDLGTLSLPPGQTRATRQLTGELGRVFQDKFDTADFYKLTLPQDAWFVTIRLTEFPDTTQWLEVFRNGPNDRICYQRGNASELCTLPIGGGVYYIKVQTDRGAANGRNLTYALDITSELVPLPNTGGRSCADAPNAGELTNGREFVGSFTPGNQQTITQKVYFGRTGAFSVWRFMGQPIEVAMTDALTGESHYLTGGDPGTIRTVILDPGFYCLRLRNLQPMQAYNVRVQIANAGVGLIPDRTDGALFVSTMSVGNLTENGRYGQQKYLCLGASACGNFMLDFNRFYVVREWVGATLPVAWMRFGLTGPASVSLGVYNSYAPVAVELRAADGSLIGMPTSNAISLDDRLPPAELKRDLPAGQYMIKVMRASLAAPGTSYHLSLVAVPK